MRLYCLKNYDGGLEAVIEEFKPHLENGLISEGLQKIAKHFESIEHVGPTSVADFEEVFDEEERERIRRDAYEQVNEFLHRLGFK